MDSALSDGFFGGDGGAPGVWLLAAGPHPRVVSAP